MASRNTEKPTGKAEKKKAGLDTKMEKQRQKIKKKPIEKQKEKKDSEANNKTTEKKEPVKKKKKVFAIVLAKNIPASAKTCAAVCKFIKNKKIETIIKELEEVTSLKKPIPMKGEIPHRKGEIMSGRYPKKTALIFLKLVKGLAANANANDIEDPVVVESIANIGERPYGKFGAVRRKRAHVFLKAKSKKTKEKK